MDNKNTYCYLPWKSITIETTGNFRICCFSGNESVLGSHGEAIDSTGKIMNVLTHSMEEALNSITHQDVRNSLYNGIRHDNCNVCWKRDDAKTENSTRKIKATSSYPFVHTDKETIELISLDLRFSNLCNMKCIMCGPACSNLWYQDWEQLSGSNVFRFTGQDFKIIGKESDMPSWENSEKFWNEFDKIKHKIKHYYILGGEPFLSKSNERLLDILINNDIAKNVFLEYDTNLSVVPDSLLEKFEKFKKVNLYVSCEDIYERYELIRFPGKFERLVSNIKKAQNKVNINAVSSCVGIYSVLSPIRIYEYFSKLGIKEFNIRTLRAPREFDVQFLSNEAKIKLIKAYEMSSLPATKKKYLINHMKNTMNKHDPEMIKKFVSRMDKLDEIRKTDWKKTFPEILYLL